MRVGFCARVPPRDLGRLRRTPVPGDVIDNSMSSPGRTGMVRRRQQSSNGTFPDSYQLSEAPARPGDRPPNATPGEAVSATPPGRARPPALPGGLDTLFALEFEYASSSPSRRPWHPSQGGAPWGMGNDAGP